MGLRAFGLQGGCVCVCVRVALAVYHELFRGRDYRKLSALSS